MSNFTPRRKITCGSFRYKGMNMRIPFQVTSKSMENTDKARYEMFRFIHFRKHAENNIPDRVKETVK